MNLPSIALHTHHNASIAVYHDNDITCVIEFERFINKKNASGDFFEPIHTKNYILESIYEYFRQKYGYTHYDKFILGDGYPEVPEKYTIHFPANEYIVDNSHHASHAYNSFAQSPYKTALIISFDGGSNDGYFNIFLGNRGQELTHLKELHIDLGNYYHLIGLLCGEIKNYHVLTAAGKVLGLQSYGTVIPAWKFALKNFFMSPAPYYFNKTEKIKKLSDEMGVYFDIDNKLVGEIATNFSRTAQEVFEEIFFENVDAIIKEYNLPIVLTGGCALNIVLNTKVKEQYNLPVFVAPNSTDCGLSVGLLCKYFKPTQQIDVTYKGIDILDKFILMEEVENRTASKVDMSIIINDLVNNKIIGIVQGNSEHGPRALGNRSIICSPIPADMKDILNHKVKHREWFRPFAPVVRLEDVSEYFEWEGESRWMNFCPKVKEQYKSLIPAVTHVDGTARVQTVTREQNSFIYDLLTMFKEKTGIGVLVNTSFNVDGKPILSTYKDALSILDNTDLDRLYLDGYYFTNKRGNCL